MMKSKVQNISYRYNLPRFSMYRWLNNHRNNISVKVKRDALKLIDEEGEKIIHEIFDANEATG